MHQPRFILGSQLRAKHIQHHRPQAHIHSRSVKKQNRVGAGHAREQNDYRGHGPLLQNIQTNYRSSGLTTPLPPLFST
jgi:hypothetical protein